MVQRGAGGGRRPEDAPTLRLVRDGEEPERTERLPAVRTPAEPAPLEGTVVWRERAIRPRVIAGRAVHVVTTAATHHRTKKAGQQVVYVATGAAVTAQRMWKGRITATFQRGLDAALAAGDQEHAVEWGRLINDAQKGKRGSGNDRIEMIAKILGKLHWITLGVAAFLLFIGIALARTSHNPQDIWAPFRAIASLVRFVTVAVTVAWFPALLAGLFVAVLACWHVGRTHVTATQDWQVGGSESADGREVIPDEGAILNALRNLAITPLNQAFKAGWRPRFVLATGRDGKGWRTQLELPAGVTVDMVNRRKDVLAHNLVRLPIEVWPTEPKTQPGVMDLWVADQGSLTGPVPPWPLLNEGGADYFKGVPVGVDIRGSTVLGRLSEANYAVAGMMGSGKSTMIITLLLGAILDPLVEVDVFVMATNADYDPMKRRLRTLLTGPGDEIVEACMDRLRREYDDLNTRGRALQEHGVRFVTRELAEKDERLRPGILVIDECFPAGTMVGGRPIESIRAGDIVPSWNEETRLPCDGVVKAIMRRIPEALARIEWHNGTTLVCTPNHPLMTREGWRAAGDLTPDSEVLSYGEEEAADHSPVLELRDGVQLAPAEMGLLQEVGAGALLARVHERVTSAVYGAGVANLRGRPQVTVPSHDGEQPDEKPADQGAGDGRTEGDGAPATPAGREWAGADRATAPPGRGSLMADRGNRADRAGLPKQGTPDALQTGYRECRSENSDRGGRPVSWVTETSGAGSAQNCVAHWRRVDRVEVLEPGSDGRYGGLCPDGYVYNFEVADTHVYRVADGVVAHNCQALYMHSDLGEEAADLTVKYISAARKYAKTLIFATPEASSASLPRKVMAVTSNKACFAIGDQQSNDAILGTGSYKAGISAVSLEPKTAEGPGDIGTAMARGFQSKPGLLRSFYVAQGQVPPVVERAMALREKVDQRAAAPKQEAIEGRDLLDDLAEVMPGAERVKLADLPGRLRKLAPRWDPYARMKGTDLERELRAAGARVVKPKNVAQLDPADLRDARTRRAARRAAEDPDGTGELDDANRLENVSGRAPAGRSSPG